jgi:hypothetical protein
MLATALPGNLVMVRCRRRVIQATVLSSHAGDNAAGMTWLRRDVDANSCRRQCCRVMLATALPRQMRHGAM